MAVKSVSGPSVETHSSAVSGPMRMGLSERMKDVFGDTEESFKQASPLSHVSGNAAPFLILYAEKDPETIRGSSAELAEALKKVKVDVRSLDVKDRTHGTIVSEIPKDRDPVTEAMLTFILKPARAR